MIRTYQGFSLLEMIIALVIIGIITAVAIPSYQHHLITARRMDGKTALLDLASRLERYYVVNNSYENATLATLGMTEQSEKGFYQLQISALTPTAYHLSAEPLGAQKYDIHCGTLTVDYLGEKGITGSGKITDCWD